jgi:hypothetical protein
MKTKIAAALLATAAMVTTACEQHDWKQTSQLFKTHGDHGHGHAGEGDHGDAHAKESGHGAAATHGEKKAESHAAPAKH